jgi:hypothetical protein
MAKESCRDLFVISGKWLGYSVIIFEFLGFCSEGCRPGLDIEQVQGPFYKVVRIIRF